MVDDIDDQTLPPRPSPFQRLKKLGITFVVLFALWALFTYVLPRLVLPLQKAPTPIMKSEGTLADKDTQIAALTERLNQMEAKLESAPKGSEAAPDAKIAELEAKIATLGDHAAQDERVKTIETKMTALQTQLGEAQAKNSRQLALMAAVDDLKDAINHGGPFGAALEKLKPLSEGQPKLQEAMAAFTPFADKGVASMGELKQSFDGAIKSALIHSNDNAMFNWHSLITIRKTGEQPGTDDEAVLARAEAALGRGDLDKTLSELATLSPPAAKAVAPWVADAENHVHAHQALTALQQAVAGEPQ